MAFIQVTPINIDTPAIINTDQVTTIWPGTDGGSRIIMADGTTLHVTEDVKDIVKAAAPKVAKVKAEVA
jgi:hypothetical protein